MTDGRIPQALAELVRFGVVGLVNTLLTGAIFVLLLDVLVPQLAYTVAFMSGIVFAAVVTPRVVFATRTTTTRRLAYGGWYVVVYAVGLVVVSAVTASLRLTGPAVAGITIACTATLGFIGARYLFSPVARRPT